MIENLSVVNGCVKWKYKGRNVILEIENAFFAKERKESHLIKVDSGIGFIENKVYYYTYDGNLELYYDLESGVVEWIYEGLRKNLVVDNMIQAVYFPQKCRMFILCDGNEQELYGYTLAGECLFKVKQPIGFKMVYCTRAEDQIWVVCDGDKENEDQYGRSRYNFLLDTDNGCLSKLSLAY
jgi:hypothetical protein